MTDLVVVVGATGTQGGSVIKALHGLPEYRIRGITRNVDKAESRQLAAQGVEMVAADLNDEASLVMAFADASSVFAVTDFYATFRATDAWTALNVEYDHGLNMARAALRIPTLKQYIWSTLPSASKISERRFFVPHFEAKARVDNFIKSQPDLLAKTTFLWVSFYVDNIKRPSFQPVFSPVLERHLVLLPISESTLFGITGDQNINIGIFVRGILSRGGICGGKHVFCNYETIPVAEYYARWAVVAGKQVHHVQISMEDFCKMMPNYGLEMGVMLQFWSAYGERSFSGEDLISAEQLGIENELVGLEEAWRQEDWSAI
ncbi:hypothetical protein H2200_010808 [Cladophialophora chaetospira]|uniref:NmrA-like domain-containing protein n=1 Tax=Cladophialophora chaetospira TaxID=386627 RepID=A0AA38X0T9_9EURO|nr:hypothetical protein H2200_010808 [Cladophialophora chaetospira]